MRRKVLAFLGFLTGLVAGTLLYRRSGARRDRVDLYFDDGSMVSLAEGSDDAGRLLAIARQILDAARTNVT